MSRPTTYENTFRLFDNAIEQWLRGLTVNYGTANKLFKGGDGLKPIITVQAKPERAFAYAEEMMIDKGWVDPNVLANNQKNFPLPIAAITRIGLFIDNQRSNSAGRYNRLALDCATKQILGADYPTPVSIMYEVNFWCLKDFTEVHITEWIHSQLGRRGASPSEFYITVQHEIDPVTGLDIYGRKFYSCRFESWADITALDEVDDAREYRFRRWNLTFTLHAWIMHPLDGEDAPKIALQIDQDLTKYVERGTLEFYAAPVVLGQCSSTANLLDLLDRPDHRSSLLFTPSDGVDITDERGISPGTNRTRTYDVTIPATGGTVQTREETPLPLLALDRPIPVRIYFKYFPITVTDLYLETLRVEMIPGGKYNKPVPSYSVAQKRDLTIVSPGRWGRFEGFANEQDWVAVRWGSVAGGQFLLADVVVQFHEADLSPTEIVDDSDMAAADVSAWTSIGGAVLQKAVPAGGGAQYMEVSADAGEGFSQDLTLVDRAIYMMIRINLLNVSGQWTIILDNDSASPTASETVVIDENWKETGLVSAPKPLSSTPRVRVISNTAGARLDVESISVRGYTGQFSGTKVPL